jgi:glucose dehydrogenase
MISQRTPTTITYMKGAWTAGIIENGGQLYDANGWPGHNAPSGYPVPKAQIGALIGKIGKNGTPFLVGDGPFLIPSTTPGGKSQ